MLLQLILLANMAATGEIAAPAGEPWPMHVIDNTSIGADGVRLADHNGDGLPDIATGWEEGNSIRVYTNPGKAAVTSPWPKIIVGAVEAPEDAVMADLDRDGAVDVISCSEGSEQQVWIHWAPKTADGPWATVAIPAASKRAKWMYALPFDVNNDGRVDIIAGAKGDGAAIGWFEAPEQPRDLDGWVWHAMRPATWIMSLELSDMNGDGDMDLVYTDRKGGARQMGWLEHPGGGETLREPWTDHLIGGQGREVMFLAGGAVTPGEAPSWWCTTRDGGILRFGGGKGAKGDSEEIPMPANTGTGKGIGVGDVDGDGVNDLVISCEHAEDKHGVFWLKKSPEGWSSHAIGGTLGTKFDLIVLQDFDGDGDLDVLTCEERERLGVIWYENPSK